MCIVWTPIPLLTWLLPVSGHLGLSDSDGLVSDFAGPYFIHQSRKKTAFGAIAKSLRVLPSELHGVGVGENPVTAWNRAVTDANRIYAGKVHNLFMENCHHHVAVVLNQLRYRGYAHWNTWSLHWLMMRRSSFVSLPRFLVTYAGLFVLFGVVLLIVLLTKFYV